MKKGIKTYQSKDYKKEKLATAKESILYTPGIGEGVIIPKGVKLSYTDLDKENILVIFKGIEMTLPRKLFTF